MPSLAGLGFHPQPGRPKMLIFYLSVCLSVRRACERQRLCAQFRQEGVGAHAETVLMPLDRRFVASAPVFNFLIRLPPTVDTRHH